LKQAVGEACKAHPMRCDESMDCHALLLNLQRFDACILARQRIMDRCYRGGNEAHREKRNESLRGRERCRTLMLARKCDPSSICE
jgi:peptide subunit release factor 1 (eRF1)